MVLKKNTNIVLLPKDMHKMKGCTVKKYFPHNENGNFSTSYIHFCSFWMEDIQMDVKSALM